MEPLVPPDLTPLEAAALALLLGGEEPELALLRGQLAQARIARRERTGVGFFTHFELAASVPALARKGRVVLGDVHGELRGLDREAGFLLVIDDGRLSMLEGFSYDESWPTQEDVLRLGYLKESATGRDSCSLTPTGSRDFAALRRCFAAPSHDQR